MVVVQESYINILVPTMDTTRYSYMLRTILASGRNVLFGADTGVGKSVIVSDTLNKMTSGAEPKFVSATVNFSAQTQSWNLQEVLETKLDKKRKNRCVPTIRSCVVLRYRRRHVCVWCTFALRVRDDHRESLCPCANGCVSYPDWVLPLARPWRCSSTT